MKTIFTFLLILFISISSNAQKTTSANQNNGTFTSGIIPATQSFKITKIYPNPVKDLVTIEFQCGVSGDIQVSLFNILGTEVKKWEPLYFSKGEQVLKTDFSSFKTGIYILKISSSDQVCTQVLKKI
ncbi:MAG: T9SS type A sorting domain-containing protein [Bacteroidota bacterium]|nr:T9SS type A sorting domain-containing protein [Bacteroidota bacterium]